MREKEDPTQSYDGSPHTIRKFNNQLTTQRLQKNVDYTTIADRLRTVGWSNNSYPTGVVNLFTMVEIDQSSIKVSITSRTFPPTISWSESISTHYKAVFHSIINGLLKNGLLWILQITIDTIFLCFCEDCERNDGQDKPYYMSKDLMVWNFQNIFILPQTLILNPI